MMNEINNSFAHWLNFISSIIYMQKKMCTCIIDLHVFLFSSLLPFLSFFLLVDMNMCNIFLSYEKREHYDTFYSVGRRNVYEREIENKIVHLKMRDF